MNPNDRIRDLILRYFHDRNAAAISEVGSKGGVACSLDTLQAELSERDGLSREQVTSNLTYLVDRGWVTTIERKAHEPVQQWKQTYQSGFGTTTFDSGFREKVSLYYQISARGIDKIEGESAFRVREKTEGINISAIKSVVQFGDGNVVSAKLLDLHYELDRLRQAITSSDISEREKLNLATDIESLKTQLAKDTPNKTVVATLWRAIESVAVAAGFIDAIGKVQPFMASLLSRLAS